MQISTTLDREIYSDAAAAEILRVPVATLRWWLDGGDRNGRPYPPVIRPQPSGNRNLTWAEFIEAGLLRQYRRELGVKLSELRRFIHALRDRSGIPYPLAHSQPWVGEGKQLLLEVQDETDLPGELSLIAVTRGQLILTPAADQFFQRVVWAPSGWAQAWRPHDAEGSPVICDPELRFGRPMIKGVSTEVLYEQLESGADEHEVAEAFDLDVADVEWARAYEFPRRPSTPSKAA